MSDGNAHQDLIDLYKGSLHEIEIFMGGVADFLGKHPSLNQPGHEIIHSYKRRAKDPEHLREKIIRKIAAGTEVNANNLFQVITDLSGVRIMHLFQNQFSDIDRVIRARVDSEDWVLHEKPKAYTWDPESAAYFRNFDLNVEENPRAYTSVHYVVRPRLGSPLSCEIQVRTLFEEIWGEVDHRINYPLPTKNIACKEQIRVLSKVVGAGSRLLDSIQRVHDASSAPQPLEVESQ